MFRNCAELAFQKKYLFLRNTRFWKSLYFWKSCFSGKLRVLKKHKFWIIICSEEVSSIASAIALLRKYLSSRGSWAEKAFVTIVVATFWKKKFFRTPAWLEQLLFSNKLERSSRSSQIGVLTKIFFRKRSCFKELLQTLIWGNWKFWKTWNDSDLAKVHECKF